MPGGKLEPGEHMRLQIVIGSSVVEFMAVGDSIGCGEIPEKECRSYMTRVF